MSIDSLYQEHFRAVYKFFYFKSLDQTIAEDLTSQTFLVLVEKMNDTDMTINDHKKFLYGIMRNVWLRFLQAKYRSQEQLIANIEDFEAYVHTELDREAETSDEERIKRFVDMLPSSQQRVMELRLLERHSLSEICHLLNRDMNYVKTTQKRAIKNLKKLLEGEQLGAAS
jgi:RNA polymerase sigma-70 factor (ECF subfamily)